MKSFKMNKSLIFKIPFFTVLAAILISVPLRVYQYLKLINPTTGFFDEKDFSVPVVYTVLAAALAVCIVTAYINHKTITPLAIGKDSKAFLAVSLIMALGTAIDCVGLINSFISLVNNPPEHIIRERLTAYVSAQGGMLILLEALFAAFSVFYFIVSGLSYSNAKSKFRLLALSPVIWCIFRLLYRFKRTIAFINVSDLLIELFTIVMAMVFFLALAQIRSKIDAESIFWKLYAYGLPAAMLSIVCFIPRIILLITGNSSSINGLHPANFSDLTFAIYAVYICISSVKTKSHIEG